MIPGTLFGDEVIPTGPLVVAVSGGLDSMVLLHRLRFGALRRHDLTVAHLDHGMRPGSGADASWLRGVCQAWGLPFVAERLSRVPGGEAAARTERYRFLERVRSTCRASAILTAHHADDQAETVLFRVFRGTGLRGLQGMAKGQAGVVRPLLRRWREELEGYARIHGVPYRDDPSNADPGFARNALRHILLPAAETHVARGSRRALVRLADNAVRAQEELDALESVLFGGLLREPLPGRIEVDAAVVPALPRPVLRRLVRAAARRVGATLDRQTTDLAVEALTRLHPGRGVDLVGGVRMERGMGEWLFVAPSGAAGADKPGMAHGGTILVDGGGPGEAHLRLGPATYHVSWSPESLGAAGEVALPRSGLLPMTIRGWTAGDRIRLPGGSRPVAKLLGEAGIPRMDRPLSPVALDVRERVVWIPGVALSSLLEGSQEDLGRSDSLFVTCSRVGHG